jgi:hypothetical protein
MISCPRPSISGAILLGGEGTNESSIIDQSDSRLADWEKKWDEMVDERGRSRAGVGRFPGASAIRDVPGGIDDILSRFLNAVFLRSHVPSCMPKEVGLCEMPGENLRFPLFCNKSWLHALSLSLSLSLSRLQPKRLFCTTHHSLHL